MQQKRPPIRFCKYNVLVSPSKFKYKNTYTINSVELFNYLSIIKINNFVLNKYLVENRID